MLVAGERAASYDDLEEAVAHGRVDEVRIDWRAPRRRRGLRDGGDPLAPAPPGSGDRGARGASRGLVGRGRGRPADRSTDGRRRPPCARPRSSRHPHRWSSRVLHRHRRTGGSRVGQVGWPSSSWLGSILVLILGGRSRGGPRGGPGSGCSWGAAPGGAGDAAARWVDSTVAARAPSAPADRRVGSPPGDLRRLARAPCCGRPLGRDRQAQQGRGRRVGDACRCHSISSTSTAGARTSTTGAASPMTTGSSSGRSVATRRRVPGSGSVRPSRTWRG